MWFPNRNDSWVNERVTLWKRAARQHRNMISLKELMTVFQPAIHTSIHTFYGSLERLHVQANDVVMKKMQCAEYVNFNVCMAIYMVLTSAVLAFYYTWYAASLWHVVLMKNSVHSFPCFRSIHGIFKQSLNISIQYQIANIKNLHGERAHTLMKKIKLEPKILCRLFWV